MLVIAMPSGKTHSSRIVNVVLTAAFYRLFIIAILATIAIAHQNYFFSRAAAGLTQKLRSLSFRAILRQDSKCLASDFFVVVDIDRLYPQLHGSTRKGTRLVDLSRSSAIILRRSAVLLALPSERKSKRMNTEFELTFHCSIVQSTATVIGGAIIGLCFGPKLAAVGIGKLD